MDAKYYNGSDEREFNDEPERELTPEEAATELTRYLQDARERIVRAQVEIEIDESEIPF